MNRRKFLIVTGGTAAVSLLLPRPSLAGERLGAPPPPTDIPGYFFFYDVGLANTEGSGPKMQAELVKAEGKTELLKWGSAPYSTYALRFEPEKAGDTVSHSHRLSAQGRYL